MKKFKTKQRKAIIKAIDIENYHPTADQVFEDVKKVIPNVSLGTIYRNLERMSADKELTALDFSNSPRRYETRDRPHYHIFCVHCSRVEDIFMDHIIDILENSTEEAEKRGFSVLGHSLEFYGVCSECRKGVENK
jgi:Fe2+ or Zn2+ uptake regulation protein